MKQILSILLIIYSFSSFAQKIKKTELIKKFENKIYKIDGNINYFKDTIIIDNTELIGYYHFNVEKIIEKNDNKYTIYYFWNDKLFAISENNKYFYFNSNIKAISKSFKEYYKEKGNKYKKYFSDNLVKLKINIVPYSKLFDKRDKYYHEYLYKYNEKKFNEIVCISKSKDFTIIELVTDNSGLSYDYGFISKNCEISNEMKEFVKKLPENYIYIKIIKNSTNEKINLPVIRIIKSK